jgi:photosystem II stability/assembly factor-like uncharacterized protein
MKKALLSFLILIIFLFSFEGCGKNGLIVKKPISETKQLYISQHGDTKENLNSVSFISLSTGIVVGNHGTILRTTNGGYKWDMIHQSSTLNLYGIAMVNANIAIAVGENGKILRSFSGGLTWDSVQTGSYITLRSVGFYSDHQGYAVGDGIVLYTIDTGKNWKTVLNPKTILNGISFNSIGLAQIVGNSGAFLKFGDEKRLLDTSISSVNLNSIHFAIKLNPLVHSDTGFIVGDKGVILKSFDGGQNWATVVSSTTRNLRGVFLSSPHWGYAVGDNGTILRYNGKHWKLLPPPPMIVRLNGVDPSWGPTSTCVGEDGNILDINPPVVNDANPPTYPNSSSIDIGSPTSCQWNFTLQTSTLSETVEEENGSRITYKYDLFEVCSSVEQDVPTTPGRGWALNERFYSKSEQPIVAHSTYGPSGENYQLDPLSLIVNPDVSVSGYITCFYLDQDGNPHLLNSYTIECP